MFLPVSGISAFEPDLVASSLAVLSCRSRSVIRPSINWSRSVSSCRLVRVGLAIILR